IFSNLRATPHQRMGVDHGAVAHVRSGIDVHRRHACHALADETTVTNARTAGHEADAALRGDAFYWVRGLIEEGLSRSVDGHVDNSAHTNPNKKAFLDPPF